MVGIYPLDGSAPRSGNIRCPPNADFDRTTLAPNRRRATFLPEDRPIHRPSPDRRTTDRTLYWLTYAVPVAVGSGGAYAALSGSTGPAHVLAKVALALLIASLIPLVALVGASVLRHREAARVAEGLADARQGDDTPVGKLMARWSVTEGDVNAYLAAREWERRLFAAGATFVAILLSVSFLVQDLRYGVPLSETDVRMLVLTALVSVGAALAALLANRAARTRAEEGPLAVIVCEDAVLFAGDLTWWRGPWRLETAALRDEAALQLISTYALFVPRVPPRNEVIALKGSGPTVQRMRTKLILPIPADAQPEAAATARALRERHGLADDRVADDPFATR